MGYIKASCAELIKEKADIVQIVGFFCPSLKARGSSYMGLSPFSKERTPSFSVSPARQRFKDYSSGKSGDVVQFLRELNGWTYPEALEFLAEKTGITLEYEEGPQAELRQQQRARKEELSDVVAAALRNYQRALRELPKDHVAWKEIERRGYSEDQVIDWGIGFAPGRGFLKAAILKNPNAGHLLSLSTEVGLIGDKGDKYWERLIYPIHNAQGRIVGLAGRDLSGRSNSAKWINPVESDLYRKEQLLFGLDRARAEIVKSKTAWIVEGYNDVIALQEYGMPNTVAPCGTALTIGQLDVLAKMCTELVFCMDPDAAGKKALLKLLPLAIAHGFSVSVVILPGMDPDDFMRYWMLPSTGYQESDFPKKMNGFEYLMSVKLQEDDAIKHLESVRELIKIVCSVKDSFHRENYKDWLQKHSKIKAATFNKLFKELEPKTSIAQIVRDYDDGPKYELPKEVKEPLEDLIPNIEKYGLFMSARRIWMLVLGDQPPYGFRAVSNFEIEIMMHMSDVKFPSKLLRVVNVHGEESVVDVPSDDVNSQMSLDNRITRVGNYLINTSRPQFNRLRQYLFDTMGHGKKVEILGQQHAGVWVFNNAVVVPGEGVKSLDKNGVYRHHDVSFYVPSANHIYAESEEKYKPQRNFIMVPAKHTFGGLVQKMMTVYGNSAINASLFAVATMFSDIVVDKNAGFPILFLFGIPSTGKDLLAEAVQTFFGKAQEPINIETDLSTGKGKIRTLAQFRNGVTHLSEYKSGNDKTNGMFKQLWDRRGYTHGTLESSIATETIPINSSIVATGNYYPDDDAVINRMIIEEFMNSQFDEQQRRWYAEFKAVVRGEGYSSLTCDFVLQRRMVELQFHETFQGIKNLIMADPEIYETISGIDSSARLVENVATLGTFYELFHKHIEFPFTWHDFLKHNRLGIKRQAARMQSASVVTKFWDTFLACVRTGTNPLVESKDFKIDQDEIALRFALVFNRVQQQWYSQHSQPAPPKAKMLDALTRTNAFLEHRKSEVYGSGRAERKVSTALVFKCSALDISNDLMEAVEWAKNQSGLLGSSDNPYAPKNTPPDAPF